MDCERCGEHVRVPRRPHPLECNTEEMLPVPPAAAVAARAGIQLHLLSLVILVAEYVVLGLAVVYWVAESGPSAVAIRDGSAVWPLIPIVVALDLTLVLGRSLLRWISYRWCEPAAGALRVGGWVIAARLAVGLRGCGYLAVLLPLLLGTPIHGRPTFVTALAETGFLVWLAGLVLEYAVLVAWHRILLEVDGPDAARRVTRFALMAGLAALAATCGLALLRRMFDTALVRSGSPLRTPDGRVNLEGLPDEIWPIVGCFLAVAVTAGCALTWQYVRVILALRASLSGAPGR